MDSHGAVALLSRGGREPRFQTNPVFIRQTFFPGCRCEKFSIRNLVNRYPDVSRIVRVFRGFFHRGIIHFIPWTTKDSRERCFWKERERERMRRDSCGKWKMILVIWILGLEQLDFRLEQGGEEGFLEGFWIYVEFN